MAQKLYEESNIQAIANTLRLKLGETIVKTAERPCYGMTNSGYYDTELEHVTYTRLHKKYQFGSSSISTIYLEAYYKSYFSSMTVKYVPYITSDSEPPADAITVEKGMNIINAQYITIFADYEYSGYDTDGAAFVMFAYGIDAVGRDITELEYGSANKTREIEMPAFNYFKTVDMAAAISSLGNEGGGSSDVTLVTKDITENGTYQAVNDSADGYNIVTVNVQPELQSKSVYITGNGTQTITADSEYDGLNSVEVQVQVSASSGSGIPTGTRSPDEYTLVYGGSYITAKYTGTMSWTESSSYGSGNNVAYFAKADTQVGDNIMDKLQTKTIQNSSYRNYGKYFTYTKSTGTPTLENIVGNPLYKYKSVSSSSISTFRGNCVGFNELGVVIFVGTWAEMYQALQNMTIDLSNGLSVLCTSISSSSSSSGSTGSITFSAD